MKKKLILPITSIIIIIGALLLFPRMAPEKIPVSTETYSANEFVLGTIANIKLYDEPPEGMFDELFQEILAYEEMLSLNISGSDINRINDAAGTESVKVQDATLEVIKEGLRFGQLSKGKFDITIGPIVNLWRIGYEDARIPAPEEITEALPLVNLEAVTVDETEGTVKLENPEMVMDLGAIAKGFIADKIAASLKARGFNRGIINLGGNVLTLGSKPGDIPFRIGIQNPWEPRGKSVGVLELRNLSLVSSGDYERFFMDGDKKYHHILSTETGAPVENNLTSVTIISKRSVDGDGLSTSVFALGLEEGWKLINSLDGVEAAFITKNKEVYLTPGIEEIYEPYNPDFEVMVWGE